MRVKNFVGKQRLSLVDKGAKEGRGKRIKNRLLYKDLRQEGMHVFFEIESH